MANKVCVYAICKNEEINVEAWLLGVKDADMIRVVDTGSTDRTVELLKNFSHDDMLVIEDYNIFGEGANFDFGSARECARRIALDNIQNRLKKKDDDFWIMLTLDFDEFANDQLIPTIKKVWNPEYDSLAIKGLTINFDNNQIESEQVISHKVHSANPGWRWVRPIHEELVLNSDSNNPQGNILFTDEETMNYLSYIHNQDLTKDRMYYERTKNAYNNGWNDSTGAIYYAWECFNKKKYGEWFRLNVECFSKVTEDTNDPHYGDWQYICQSYTNIINYLVDYVDITVENKNGVASDLKVFTSIMSSIIIQDKNMPENRRINFSIYRANIALASILNDEKYIHNAIDALLKLLSVRERPFCWYDDDELYDDSKIFKLLSEAYSSIGDNGNALIFNMCNAMNYPNNREELEKSISKNMESIYINSIEKLNGREISVDKIINELKEKYKIDSPKDEVDNNQQQKSLTNKICVYAICKNESQFVDAWVDSMQEADSIVVLDTGSTDDTVEKLRARGVTVKVQEINPWRFDVARNIALEMAPKDCNILVSTDLDEILEPGWAEVLRNNWIEGVHKRANYKYSWSHLPNGESGRVFAYDKIHSRGWIWKYPVHELLWNVERENEFYTAEETLYVFDKIHLHHYPDRSKSRSSYLPLLELRKKENSDDYYGLIYLAHEYFYQNQFQKSIDELNYILDNFSDKYTTVEQASCYLFIGDNYIELNDNESAVEAYTHAIEIEPTYREPYINLAKAFMNLGKLDDAIETLKTGIMASYRHYSWLERDVSWTYEPWDLLSLCFYYNEHPDYKASLFYAMYALSFEPNDERLINNVNMIKNTIKEDEII